MRELCQHQSSFSRQVQVFSRHHNIRPISEQMLGNTSYMTVHICDAQHFNVFCPRTSSLELCTVRMKIWKTRRRTCQPCRLTSLPEITHFHLAHFSSSSKMFNISSPILPFVHDVVCSSREVCALGNHHGADQHQHHHRYKSMGGDLAPNLGGPKNFFAAQFQEKCSFSG